MYIKSGNSNSECCLCVTLAITRASVCYVNKLSENVLILFVYGRGDIKHLIISFSPDIFKIWHILITCLCCYSCTISHSITNKADSVYPDKQTSVDQRESLSAGKWKVLSTE